MKIDVRSPRIALLAAPLLLAFAVRTTSDDTLPPVGSPGGPSHALTPAEAAVWLRGRALFQRSFHEHDGVGTPNMNADSCRACHRDPAFGGAGGLDVNVSRFGRDNGGAGPFQNLPGGQALSKLQPPYVGGREEYDPAQADCFEQRQTPTLFGAGLIDTIPESEIALREDPNDLDGDGIRGVARRIDVAGHVEIGRFGWKAQIPHLRDFIRDAMGNENGMTTSDDGRGFAIVHDTDAVADPEFTDAQIDDLDFFLSNLAQPARGGSLDPQVAYGQVLFTQIGCAKCHVPELQGANGPVPLFSDLLLHDVMPASFHGMEEPGAASGFYRTPPLWGIRDTAPYLHDGRAENLRAAIRAHDGEARAANVAFHALAEVDRDAVLAFLDDL